MKRLQIHISFNDGRDLMVQIAQWSFLTQDIKEIYIKIID